MNGYGLPTELRVCKHCKLTRWGTVLGGVWICSVCGKRQEV